MKAGIYKYTMTMAPLIVLCVLNPCVEPKINDLGEVLMKRLIASPPLWVSFGMLDFDWLKDKI